MNSARGMPTAAGDSYKAMMLIADIRIAVPRSSYTQMMKVSLVVVGLGFRSISLFHRDLIDFN